MRIAIIETGNVGAAIGRGLRGKGQGARGDSWRAILAGRRG
jgi:hypothetical protein